MVTKVSRPKKADTAKPAPKKKPVKSTTPDAAITEEIKGKPINCQLPGWEDVLGGVPVEEVAKAQERELNPQQERFCREYLHLNQTRAYIKAYPGTTYETAGANACRLLKDARIIARVEELTAERNKRLEISADKVLRRLEARASFSPVDLYDENNNFIPINELDRDVAIGIKSIEVVELYDNGKGDQKQAIGLIRKITVLDGKASDELLGRNLSLWKEVGSKDNPLTVDKLPDEALDARLAQLEARLKD
jgi:hypothetical protein